MEAIESADREIALARSEVATRICQLQTRRNTLVPFFPLPPEVLLCIVEFLFMFEKYDSRIFAASLTVESRLLRSGWRPFMNVCTRTRALLLDSPRFWTRVGLVQNPKWVRLCMERSQSFDLSVLFCDDDIPHAECSGSGCCYNEKEQQESSYELFHRKLLSFQHLIKDTLPRARQVDLRLSERADFHTPIDAALCSFLPRLQSLTYHLSSSDPDMDEMPTSLLFLRGVPALTFLVLSCIDISVTDMCFPLLFHLDLDGVYIDGDSSEMIRFLERSPLLENVRLEVYYSYSPSSIRIQPILLPKLRKLILRLSLDDCMMDLPALPSPADELRIEVGYTMPASERSQIVDHV
jgi:hypothetical protein